MSTDIKPVKLSDLNPANNPAYSPNLFAWLKKKKDTFCDADGNLIVTLHVGKNGYIYVGRQCDDGSICNRLNTILGKGAKEDTWYMLDSDIAESNHRPNFWNEYKAIGRCAIDTDHETHFIHSDSRYKAIDDDTRQCTWCGETHRKVIQHVVEIKTRDHWLNEEKLERHIEDLRTKVNTKPTHVHYVIDVPGNIEPERVAMMQLPHGIWLSDVNHGEDISIISITVSVEDVTPDTEDELRELFNNEFSHNAKTKRISP